MKMSLIYPKGGSGRFMQLFDVNAYKSISYQYGYLTSLFGLNIVIKCLCFL